MTADVLRPVCTYRSLRMPVEYLFGWASTSLVIFQFCHRVIFMRLKEEREGRHGPGDLLCYPLTVLPFSILTRSLRFMNEEAKSQQAKEVAVSYKSVSLTPRFCPGCVLYTVLAPLEG